ncbi:MAG: ABC transporter permease [Terriglobales bacterium]
MGRDLRYAWRQIRSAPGLAIVIVISLALGIGANTAVFSLDEAILLRNLPVQDPGRLVSLHWNGNQVYGATDMGPPQDCFSYPAFLNFQARASDLGSILGSVALGFTPQNTNVVVNGHPGLANGVMVTGEYFSGLGIAPLLGRTLTPADQTAGAAPVADISYGYWTRRFARDPGILGRSAAIDGLNYTVVGVLPPSFHGLWPMQKFDLWVPMLERPGLGPYGYAGKGRFLEAKDRIWMGIMGRLKPGVTQAAAQAQLDGIWHSYMEQTVTPRPKPGEISRLELQNGAHGLNGLTHQASQPLLLMMILAGLILLVACANVAALLLARATGRKREIGVRLALGAPRGRLVRQLLTESILLAVIAAALGLLLAEFGARALANQVSAMGVTVSPTLDGRVLLFTAVVAIVTGMLFGILPALRATRIELSGALNDRGATGGARLGAGRALVVAQVAVSLILLVVAGLLVRTLHNLESQDFGFPTSNMLEVTLNPVQTGYTGSRLRNLYVALRAKLASLPGVKAATLAMSTPLSGGGNGGGARAVGVKHQPAESYVRWDVVGASYLHANGIPLLMGRDLGEQDTATSQQVVIVNQFLAKRFFPGQNPIGRQLLLDGPAPLTIVGVMRDAKYGQPEEPMQAQAVVPFTQMGNFNTGMDAQLRTYAAPEALLGEVRQAVESLDPGLPLANVRTEKQEAAQGVAGQRMFAWLAGFLGMMGLILAAIGLEGSMAYLVARRTPEIGIRMALGAGGGEILGMILRQALGMVGLGIVIGVPIVLFASRYLASALYRVPPDDPASLATGIILLAVVGTLAAWLPARRAAHVDPLQALRVE